MNCYVVLVEKKWERNACYSQESWDWRSSMNSQWVIHLSCKKWKDNVKERMKNFVCCKNEENKECVTVNQITHYFQKNHDHIDAYWNFCSNWCQIVNVRRVNFWAHSSVSKFDSTSRNKILTDKLKEFNENQDIIEHCIWKTCFWRCKVLIFIADFMIVFVILQTEDDDCKAINYYAQKDQFIKIWWSVAILLIYNWEYIKQHVKCFINDHHVDAQKQNDEFTKE